MHLVLIGPENKDSSYDAFNQRNYFDKGIVPTMKKQRKDN